MLASIGIAAVVHSMQQWAARFLSVVLLASASFAPQFARAGGPVTLGVVQSGEIDATTLTYDQAIAANARGWKLKVVMPNLSVIVKSSGGKRFHVLMSSREARGMITDVLVLKDSVIGKNPKLAEGLIRGTMEGLAFMKTDPGKAAAIIAKTLEISAAEVQEQPPNIENPSLANLGDVFKKTAVLPSFHASGKIIGDILKHEGQIETTPAIETTYDASFVDAVQAHPGG